MDTKKPDVEALTRVAAEAASRFDQNVPEVALRKKVEDILFHDKDMWVALLDGIITAEEARDCFLANVETWLRNEFALGWDIEKHWVSPEIEAIVEAAMRPR
jgi:hypothetical protein